jgi:hypothetical protein
MRPRLAAALVLSAVALLTPAAARACACCAEPGERMEYDGRLESYDAGVVDGLVFDPAATLYSTAADWTEQVRGIDNPAQSYDYTLKLEKDGRVWRFDLTDAAGHRGSLSFRRPAQLRKLHIDTAPQPPDEGQSTNVSLYKEWRLQGPVRGNGMFTLGRTHRAEATLILHGSGNNCTDSSQFGNWTLDVTGEGVRFRFFGKLVSGEH